MIINGQTPNGFYSETTTTLGLNNYVEINAICQFGSTSTWYISVRNVESGTNDSSADFQFNITTSTVTPLEVTLGTETPVTAPTGAINTNFGNSFSFFSFATDSAPALGETLKITVNNTNVDSMIYFNAGSIPAYYDENSCVAVEPTMNTLTIDYCEWSGFAPGTFYVSVSPPGSFDITIERIAPSISTITPNQVNEKVYYLTPNTVQYFTFSANDDELINATISSIQGGTVDFSIEYENLPFVSCQFQNTVCNPDLSNCCQDVTNTCELVVQPCYAQAGAYYLGVKPTGFAKNNIPISFRVTADNIELPSSDSLRDGDFSSSTVFQSHYSFFEFDPSSVADDEDATLNVHLYVDRTSAPGTQTILYVNFDDMAGAEGSCWDNVDSCTVTDEGSCSIQIIPCLYSQYDDWYVSVFGGNSTSGYGTSTDFTVLAKLNAPYVLDEPYYVINSAVYDNHVQHYQLDGDLLSSGSLVVLAVTDVKGGDVSVYLNYGDLAGPIATCPLCFNNTAIRSTDTQNNEDSIYWPIANCNDTINENRNDVYFAVQGYSLPSSANPSKYVGYSITVIASEDVVEPSNALNQNDVLVDSIQTLAAKNYSVNGDPDNSAAYLMISLTQVDNIDNGLLTLHIYNTSNLNCVLDSYSSSCTVNSATGYCSIVIQNCNFNTSDSWIASVYSGSGNGNSNGMAETHYNLYYDIYGDSAIEVDNGTPYAGTVFQNQVQQFEYSAQGYDTLIIEVFFDQCQTSSSSSSACVGTLYVSTDGATGPAGCFYNQFEQSDSEKVVYAVSACDLPDETFYFSVSTTSNLYPNFPFAYTVLVTEKSYVVPLTVNVPISDKIFRNEKVYYTFSFTYSKAQGSRLLFELTSENDNVSAYLATDQPPSEDDCPCFEYAPVADYDYCQMDLADGTYTWTLMLQTNGGAENAEIGYTLTVLSLSQKPLTLNIDTNQSGSLYFAMYNYYTLTGTTSTSSDSLVTLTINNVQGGTVSVYFDDTYPATQNCNVPALNSCGAISDSCTTQINGCGGLPTFVSVYAESTFTYDPVTYDIIYSESSAVNITGNSHDGSIGSTEITYFTYSATNFLAGATSPQITFHLDNIDPNPRGLSIFAKMGSVCGGNDYTVSCPGLGTSCSLTISFCDGMDGMDQVDLYFEVQTSITSNTQTTYTASVTTVDYSAGAAKVTINEPYSVIIPAGGYKAFTVTVPPGTHDSQSLFVGFTVSNGNNGAFDGYISTGAAVPGASDCGTLVSPGIGYTVSSCCVEDSQVYNFVIQSSSIADTNVTVSANTIPVNTATVAITSGNSKNHQLSLQPSETAEFSFTLNEQSQYLNRYVYVQTNTSNYFYLNPISLAGSGGCLNGDSYSAQTRTAALFTEPQCSGSPYADAYESGTYFVGIENPPGVERAVGADILYGVQRSTPLTKGETMNDQAMGIEVPSQLSYFYSYQVPNMTTTQQAQISFGSNTSFTFYIYQGNSNEMSERDIYCSSTPISGNFGGVNQINTIDLGNSNICEYAPYYLIRVVSNTASSTYEQFPFNITANMVDRYDSLVELSSTETNAFLYNNTFYYTIGNGVNAATEYVELNVMSFSANPANNPLRASFYVEGVAMSSTTCSISLDYTFVTNEDGTYDYSYIIDPCNIAPGAKYYFNFNTQNTGNYDVVINTVQAPITAIMVDSVNVDSVAYAERKFYTLTLDYTNLQPGNEIVIKASSTCGEVEMYVSQGSITGPSCGSFVNSNVFTLSKCDVISSPVSDYQDSTYYITIVGSQVDFDVVQYFLEVKVSGFPAVFESMGPNQVVTFNGYNTVYNLPIQGLNDFVGQLQLFLYTNSSSATLYYSLDTPTICDNSQSLEVDSNNRLASVLWNSCDLSNHRQIYFQFAAGSDVEANFEITHYKPFVRDLDQYTAIPQSGAVVASAPNSGIIDEEYYRISLNPFATGFQFNAYITTNDEDDDDNIQLMASQSSPPSLCSDTVNGPTPTSVTYDWCQVDLTNEMYLTVNSPASSMGVEPMAYELYYTTVIDASITSLVANTPLCDVVEADGWNYYSAEIPASATSQTSVTIYAIDADNYYDGCSLNAYLSIGSGIATSNCNNGGVKRCNGPCNGLVSQCSWEFDCVMSGNISISVNNPSNNDVNYFIVWNQTPVTPVALKQNVTQSGTGDEYFSFTLPTDGFDSASQYLVVSAYTDASDSLQVLYNTNEIPSSGCALHTCNSNGGCSFLVSPCDYPSAGGTGYILVEAGAAVEYTVEYFIYDANPITIYTNASVETSLTLSNMVMHGIDLVTYKLTISDSMIAQYNANNFGTLNVMFYGVSDGSSIDAWINYGSIGDYQGLSSCNLVHSAIPAPDDDDTLTVDGCSLIPGDYYISAALSPGNQANLCNPVSVGVKAFFTSSDETAVTLKANTAYTQVITAPSEDLYSYSDGGADVVGISVNTNSAAVGVAGYVWYPAYQTGATPESNCFDQLNGGMNYFWGCSKLERDSFGVVVQSNFISTSRLLLPNTTYSIEVSTMSFHNLTDNAVEDMKFSSSSAKETHFYSFSNSGGQSVQIDLDVDQGPSVLLKVWNSSCNALGGNNLITSYTCYSGHCEMPFSWGNGAVFNSSYTIYITVEGYGPSTYDLEVYYGESETCYYPESTDLCDISWSVWDYHGGEQAELNQAVAAQRLYNVLLDAFCPPCGCTEVSNACNNSLIEMACTQTYRACSDSGLQTSVCEDTCEDIEENCGYTFEQVGLPFLSCGHNFYYGDFDSICEDTYGITETDGTDVLLWIVIVIVVLLILLLVLGAGGFFAYKKFKAKHQQYDQIGDDHEALDS